MRALLVAILVAFAVPAQAQQGPAIAVENLITCYTQAQMERYVKILKNKDYRAAGETIDKEFGTDHACGFTTIAFQFGAPVSKIETDGRTYRIFRILVWVIKTDRGPRPLTPPQVWYVAELLPEEKA